MTTTDNSRADALTDHHHHHAEGKTMKLTLDNAIAAIDDFEIVGENNLSRDPTPEERFVLREFVARLFEDATPEISFSLTKDERRSLATKAASEAARIPGSTLYNAAEFAIEEACKAFTARDGAK